MGRIMAKKVRGMNWKAKISLVLVFTMVFSTFMYQGLYQPKPASAAVANRTQWAILGSSATTIASLPAMSLAKGAGTNRLLVVSFVGDYATATTTFQPTITYGGQTLTRITSTDTTSRQKVWIGYLNEAGITAATGTTPAFAVSGVTPDTGCGLAAAFYDGVLQATPITASRAVSSDTTATTPTSGAINVTTGGWAIYASNVNGAVTSTAPAGWPATEHFDTANGTLYQFAVNSLAITTTGTQNPQPTWATARYAFLSASLSPAATCTDTDPATLTTTNPTGSSTVSGTRTVQTQVGVETVPSGLTGMVVNITGSTGCNVTNGAMTWNAGTSRWEYSWNTAACGTTTPDTGVSITVSGTDPDCGTAVSAAAVTNVTIDNGKLPSTITSCAGCHPYAPTFTDGTARNTPAGEFQGSHNPHVQDTSITCSACHVAPATETAADFDHRNGTIQMQASIRGGTYSRGASFAQANSFTPGTCATTSCHGTNSGTWGTNTANDVCTKCHGVPTAAPAAAYKAAPGADGTGVDTAGQSAATDAQVGAHNTHLLASINISNPVACNECHTVPATSSAAGHNDSALPAELTWGTLATKDGKIPSYTSPNCTSVYCHTASRPAGTGAGQGGLSTVTAWTNTALLGNTSITDTCINKCHEMPPRGGVAGDAHAGLTAPGTYTTPASLAACSSNSPGTGCHPTINGAPTSMATIFFNRALHVDGIVQGGECISCHAVAVSSPTAQALDATVTTRRAVVAEFSNTWSHKRSFTGTPKVTNNDCGVCHMEGNAADGSINATFHRNGRIELRDPDTGLTIKQATWGGTGAGAYTSNTTDATFVRFSRNLSSNTLETPAVAIMINQCLKCHDANGASNASARVGANALQPFGVAITGHVAPFDINGQGNVVNVAGSFATTNSTYHPILGKQNNSYAQGVLMIAPWNMTKTTGNITSWGYLMTCWDCHAPTGATGVQTTTVTAHGGTVTVRAGIYQSTANTAATNLCINCHATTYATTSANHASTSAFTGGNSNMNATTMQRCQYCHAYTAAQGGTAATNLASRPLRGENYHGFNDRTAGTVGSRWVNGTASHRPYSFIRNTLSYWSPTSVSTAGETLQRSRGCTGTGGTCNNNMGATTTYSGVGGVY